jgi:hypothetical protein
MFTMIPTYFLIFLIVFSVMTLCRSVYPWTAAQQAQNAASIAVADGLAAASAASNQPDTIRPGKRPAGLKRRSNVSQL